VFILYILQHHDAENVGDKCKKIGLAPLFMILQQVKVLSGFESVHAWFGKIFGYSESYHLLSMENTFKLQTVIELFFQTVPQMIIQSSNNNAVVAAARTAAKAIDNNTEEVFKWNGLATFTMILSVLMFIKNLGLITIYVIRRFIDHREDPPMRPRTTGYNFSKVEKEAFAQIQGYLIDPHDDGVDIDGNTTVHQLLKTEPNSQRIESRLHDLPHHLFMLNKFGQTPLDIAIQEAVAAPAVATP